MFRLGQQGSQRRQLGLAARQRFASGDPRLFDPPVGAVRAHGGKAGCQVAIAREEQGVGETQLLPAPAWLVRVVLGEQAVLLLGSRRVAPARALELGYDFRYRTIDAAFEEVLG